MSSDSKDISSMSAADIDENYKSIILNDVQGDIVLGFSKEKELFWFCQIRDPAKFKEGLTKLDITNGQAVLDKKAEIAKCPKGTLVKAPFLNIAFTSKGLEELGLSSDIGEDRRALDENNKNFGGHDEFRFKTGQRVGAESLGDRGTNKPGDAFDPDWESAFKGAIHVLFLIAAESWSTIKEKQQEVQDCLGASIHDVYSFKGAVRPKPHRGHEHFGWLDDVSNPGIRGVGIDGEGTFLPGQIQLKPGVLLCGMEGDRVRAGRPPWAKGGSCLAFRQLEQKVPEFHKFLAETSATVFKDPSPEGAHKLGAHLVGRWKSGAPLQITPEKDDEKLGQDKFRNNKFTFPQNRGDMGQALCPYSAHIRKTNPRADLSQDDVEARAIRRAGITYGPELTASEIRDQVSEFERGLAFVCYQSDIARGFEFMQLAWANNPGFIFGKGLKPEDPGFKSDLPRFRVGFDPLIGQSGDGNEHKRDTWGSENGPKIHDMPEFVCSRGGEYFFLPTISTLKNINKFCS